MLRTGVSGGQGSCGLEHVEFEVTLREPNRKVSGQLKVEIESAEFPLGCRVNFKSLFC